MPLIDPADEFRRDVEAYKQTKVARNRQMQQLRQPQVSKTTKLENEVKQLRKQLADRDKQIMAAKQLAAATLGRANRMSTIPTHVVKDFVNDLMRALDKR